MDFEAYSDS